MEERRAPGLEGGAQGKRRCDTPRASCREVNVSRNRIAAGMPGESGEQEEGAPTMKGWEQSQKSSCLLRAACLPASLDFPGRSWPAAPPQGLRALSPPPVEESSVGTGPEPQGTKGTGEMLSSPLAMCWEQCAPRETSLCSSTSLFQPTLGDPALWTDFCPRHIPRVKILACCTSECDCIWKQGLERGDSVTVRSLRWP